MVETGRMEALQRPLLLLRDAAAADLPANMNGLLYEDLRTSGSDLTEEPTPCSAKTCSRR